MSVRSLSEGAMGSSSSSSVRLAQGREPRPSNGLRPSI